MRILPVNNYNYQAKPQNNKQQNINFGLLKGSEADTLRLCKEGFKGLAEIVLENSGRVKKGTTELIRTFSDAERTALAECVAGENINIVASPGEVEIFNDLFGTHPDLLSNKVLIDAITTEIEHVTPVTEQMRTQLDKFRYYVDSKANCDNMLSAGVVNQERHDQMIANYSTWISEKRADLYDASIAK